MAEIDRQRFSADVAKKLEGLGFSHAAACAAFPGTDKAMWSRAKAGQALSAGNTLLVCRALGLDPFAYLDARPRAAPPRRREIGAILKRMRNQADTQAVSREARG